MVCFATTGSVIASQGILVKAHLIKKVGRLIRRVRHKLLPGAIILRYHRISELAPDPHALCVAPDFFAAHLEILSRLGRPMSLRQLVASLRNGPLPRRAVVITLDDGYADSLSHAKPLLERYGVPATVFVISGFLGCRREFWWDELETLLLQPGTLPARLRLDMDGAPFEGRLEHEAHYSEDEFRRNCRAKLKLKEHPSPRHQLYRRLHDLLQPMSRERQWDVLDRLAAWAGTKPTIRQTHRPLTPEELVRLGEGKLIEVGAHSVTHPILSRLPAAAQREEIEGSKHHLEEILGQPVTSFAYPYGSHHDFSAETAALVQDAGFESACSTTPDVIFRGADLFRLPRLYVGNWDGEEFARRLGVRV
jgi:peptidoglycan/xylan/chitin deacetylase (PgdA/CDA1 family)